MARKMIYIRDADERIWEQAQRAAGDKGVGSYLMRLARSEQLGLRRSKDLTPDEKFLEGLRLLQEAREELTS